jgi:peptidoglycan/xylan/chitin deacetylase (PgdA/CDA1 family)
MNTSTPGWLSSLIRLAGRTRPARLAVVVISAVALALAAAGAIAQPARADTPALTLSLTFDDSLQDQYTNALPILQQYGMKGTFYVITGYIGVNSAYMTQPELQTIYGDGDEIAGHTVLHPYLTQVNADEAKREICQSRDTLLTWGFPVTNFAYPYSDYNAAVEGLVQQCGYNSGRLDYNLASPSGCDGCDVTDTFPLPDTYAINTPTSVRSTWTLADLENMVTNGESAGGWMPIVFHHICENNCDFYATTPEIFSAFLSWLQTQNVSVKTVAQMIGGSVQSAVTAATAPPAGPGVNGVANASLETADPNNAGFPYCWVTSTGAGTTASYAETSGAHTGSVAETVTVSAFTGGDAKLITKQDLGECAPTAVAGDSYVASGWYKSSVPTRFVFWYRDGNGGWHYWTQSPQFAAASGWTQATWATAAVPAGATGLSFGMNIAGVGTLTTDDYSLADSGGAPTPPTATLTGPVSGSTLSGTVTFTSSASSNVGVTKVDYLVNGQVVATGTAAPSYSATWDSTTVGDGAVTVTARATDTGGNQGTSAAVPMTVSNAASRGGNMLANASLETDTSGTVTPDCWQLGGTGTNTYTWSRNSSAHTGSWAQTVTVSSYTSGDRKLVTSQGANACSPRITPGSTYSLGAWYESTQTAHIVAYYQNAAGSWVYWTQSPAFAASASWAQATWTTPAVPAGAVAVSFGVNIAATGTLTTDDYSMIAGG